MQLPAIEGLKNIHVVASTPSAMEAAQGQLIEWADSRIEHEKVEMADAERCLVEARGASLRLEPFKRRIAKHRQRINYFRKVAAALKAGYYIVPPFPAQVFAIRTDAHNPRAMVSDHHWNSSHNQSARALPPDSGRYVSPQPQVFSRQIEFRNDKSGTMEKRRQFFAKNFQEVDFPFAMVKPEVIEATRRALDLRIFDELAALPAFRSTGDPIVVGRIKDPTRPHKEPLTFFVTWWLDTAEI